MKGSKSCCCYLPNSPNPRHALQYVCVSLHAAEESRGKTGQETSDSTETVKCVVASNAILIHTDFYTYVMK